MDIVARNLVVLHANNKGANQPTHPRNLVSAFVICSLESKQSELAATNFNIHVLYSYSVTVSPRGMQCPGLL